MWYNHFIYSVFKQKLIYPHLEPSKSNKDLFPSYLINKSLHMYLREAKRVGHVVALYPALLCDHAQALLPATAPLFTFLMIKYFPS